MPAKPGPHGEAMLGCLLVSSPAVGSSSMRKCVWPRCQMLSDRVGKRKSKLQGAGSCSGTWDHGAGCRPAGLPCSEQANTKSASSGVAANGLRGRNRNLLKMYSFLLFFFKREKAPLQGFTCQMLTAVGAEPGQGQEHDSVWASQQGSNT